jgi:L-fuculose-phosphate aldolase
MSSAREQLIAAARHMAACGLNSGTAGNISVRHTEEGIDGFLITPTGMNYDALVADDIVFMRLDGTPSAANTRRPSSEWRLHRDLYAACAPAGAVAHAHSPFATSLACLRRDIPPFHYMIARFGGDTLRCADYATFGTQALSDAALLAMQGRQACLLANHGMLVWGRDLDQALALASELETLCEQYWRVCAIGSPALLAVDEMATVLEKFADYGRQD